MLQSYWSGGLKEIKEKSRYVRANIKLYDEKQILIWSM